MTFNKYPICEEHKDSDAGMTGVSGTTNPNSTKVSKNSESNPDGEKEPEEVVPEKENNPLAENKKEQTRGKMASVFILGFFIIIFMCFVYAAWKQAEVEEVKDLIIAVIGALSGLVGFVIGYYFKTK